jgi:hypothetical protein
VMKARVKIVTNPWYGNNLGMRSSSCQNECKQIGRASEPTIQAMWEQHESECWIRWLQHNAKGKATKSS